MPKSQRTDGDLQFFLSKLSSSTVSLPNKDSSKITETKTVDLHLVQIKEMLSTFQEIVATKTESYDPHKKYISPSENVIFSFYLPD